jgi:hypothetical protein
MSGLGGQSQSRRTPPKMDEVGTDPRNTDKSYVQKKPSRKPTTLYLDPEVFMEFSKVNSYKGEKSDLVNHLLAKHFGLISEEK